MPENERARDISKPGHVQENAPLEAFMVLEAILLPNGVVLHSHTKHETRLVCTRPDASS
jgi:hypothetical protein